MQAKPVLLAACIAGVLIAAFIPSGGAAAQDETPLRSPRATARVRPVVAVPARARDLTINRRPQNPDTEGSPDDVYVDGPIRYNSVRTFDPVPYADSGRQFPFGLDGIGGYGSDLGFLAGHDSAVYDRGP